MNRYLFIISIRKINRLKEDELKWKWTMVQNLDIIIVEASNVRMCLSLCVRKTMRVWMCYVSICGCCYVCACGFVLCLSLFLCVFIFNFELVLESIGCRIHDVHILYCTMVDITIRIKYNEKPAIVFHPICTYFEL